MTGSASSMFCVSLLSPLCNISLWIQEARADAHSLNNSIDLMPPLRPFFFAVVEHHTILNLI